MSVHTSGSNERLHVAVAVISDAEGRILVARRPPHVHQGGLWEFPGGKVESGESTRQALRREILEELDLEVHGARPLIRVCHDYPGRAVLLDVWRVTDHEGVACGREGQALRWVAPAELGGLAFPAANLPIVRAVQLPARYLITPPFFDGQQLLARLAQLAADYPLIQLRAPQYTAAAFAGLARRAMELCARRGARLLLNCEPGLARELGAAGVHLNSRRLMALRQRPLPPEQWVAASCHDEVQLARAAELGLDFAVLSPLATTASHPGNEPLGWERFRLLTEQAVLPVYALGGLSGADLSRAWEAGAQGIAAIRAFWNQPS
ncbi:MAG: Nudix family hydrolase [Gammaproteobacteria bacterium]